MDLSGKLIERGDKVLYVFGTAKVPWRIPDLVDDYFIGVNLDTGEIEDGLTYSASIIPFDRLTQKQQINLSRFIPVYHKLKGNIVSISAKARSGKDELAKVLLQTYHARRVAFGDPIKQITDTIYGTNEKKDREKYILIGQGLRAKDPNIWIKTWLRRVINYVPASLRNTLYVVPDVRQPNEFSFLSSLNALTIKIEANEEMRLEKIRELDGEKGLDESLLKDETETALETFVTDVIITNNYDNKFYEDIRTLVLPALSERGW